MNKISSLEDLDRIKDKIRHGSQLRINNKTMQVIKVKVAMATCSIASGSRETFNYFRTELDKRNIDAEVSQTGCMGYCYAEPTVEIILPGKEPIVFGRVDAKKADEIISNYIKAGILVDDIIPVNYKKISEN